MTTLQSNYYHETLSFLNATERAFVLAADVESDAQTSDPRRGAPVGFVDAMRQRDKLIRLAQGRQN